MLYKTKLFSSYNLDPWKKVLVLIEVLNFKDLILLV